MEYSWLITEAVLGPLEGMLAWRREGYQLPMSLKSKFPGSILLVLCWLTNFILLSYVLLSLRKHRFPCSIEDHCPLKHFR